MIWMLFACSTPPAPVVGTQPVQTRQTDGRCPMQGQPVVRGTLEDRDLEELSGIAKSRQHEVFWAHNDSGDGPRLYAVGPKGRDRGHFDLRGAQADDWEDMAFLPTETGDFLFLADIGDNDEERKTVEIYRIAEPAPGMPRSVEAETMVVTYPDGPRNAETLLADPRDGALYILTKTKSGKSELYGLGPFKAGSVRATVAGGYDFPTQSKDTAKATGGTVSPDGKWVAIRTYATVWLFPLEGSLPDAFKQKPCEIHPPSEEQGEAVTFVEGGLVTISEGEGAPVHFVPFDR